MKIGILGAGNIGGTIGKQWAKAGHDIMFGVRTPESDAVKTLLNSIDGTASADTLSNAIAFGEAILIAIPGKTVEQVIIDNANAFAGKIIIDAANNMRQPVMNNLSVIQEHVPDAKIYRAFNSLGWENFAQPEINGEVIDLFYCGTEGDTKAIMESLIQDVGLRPIYIGNLDTALLIDMLTSLWGSLAYGQGKGRRLGFKLITPE